MAYIHFTPEQEQWLRDNFDSADTYASLTAEFNERFGTERSQGQISDKCCKRMKLLRGKNIGQFRKGGGEEKRLPIGTIRKTQTGTYIKVCDTITHFSGYKAPNWIPLQQKVWEDAHGKLQPGQMVCFLDHNKENFALNNLYPINRKISVRISQNRWWSDNPEITMAAILQCKLFVLLKEGSLRSYGKKETD